MLSLGIIKIEVMEKFTKLERAIIIASLNQAMSNDLAEIQVAEEAGKNLIFTAEYVQGLYVALIGKVEGMTKKK